jgi:deoxyribonuclease V
MDSFIMPPRLVGGIDVAYHGEIAYATVVVLDYETLEMVESANAELVVKNSYIPSFLAFRELKPMIKSIRKLKIAANVFLVDAQGIAHPERCGLASHLGVVLDIPTIGVAKSLLIGEVSDLDEGGLGYLKDKEELIGASIVSRVGCKPIYVSIGHKVSLDSAIEIVRATTKRNRIPEPLRLAHVLANLARAKASK